MTTESQSILRKAWSWLASIGWRNLLKAALALALISIVLLKTNLQQILALKDLFSWTWLFISFALFCLMTVVKSNQYWALLGDRRVSFSQILRVVVLQNVLTNLVSNAAGIASYLTMLHVEQNVKLRQSGVIFIITKAGDLLSMAFFLLLSGWVVWARINVLHELVLLLLVVILSSLIIFWTAVFFRRKFVLQLRSIIYRMHLDRFDFALRGLSTLQTVAEHEQETAIHVLLLSSLLSMSYMTLTMAYAYSRAMTFHIPLDFWAIVFIASLTQLISIVPIQIFGGLGVTEFTSVYLYDLFGVVQVDIPAILVGLRVLFYLFNAVQMLYLPLNASVARIRSVRNRKPGKMD